MPWEPALQASAAMDGEAQPAPECSFGPGGPKQTSGDRAWPPPKLPLGQAATVARAQPRKLKPQHRAHDKLSTSNPFR